MSPKSVVAAGLALAAGLTLALVTLVGPASSQQPDPKNRPVKSYQSNNKNFWLHPPEDWFIGDETEAQKGLFPNAGQPLPTPLPDLEKMLAKIKLPQGFKISVWVHDIPQARQIALGDKGTLFVGTFDKGIVYAVTNEGGKRVVKQFIKGLRMATGVAFVKGSLYVIDIDKLYKYENPEANLDQAPAAKIVYDDMPPYIPHGWKYLIPDKDGHIYMPFGVPCNICLPPTSTAQFRRVDPETGSAELVALGVRNSVGGDVDPRTGDLWFTENARDWLSDDLPNDKLNHVSRMGEHFGYPYCHQGDLQDPVFGKERKCSEFSPPVAKLGPHVAPLGMKFYTGTQFPAEYRNNIFIAEHGSWNRHNKIGYRIKRVIVDADGKNAKQEIFAESWLEGQTILGRPADIFVHTDGSLLVADDQTGAIYQITYGK